MQVQEADDFGVAGIGEAAGPVGERGGFVGGEGGTAGVGFAAWVVVHVWIWREGS